MSIFTDIFAVGEFLLGTDTKTDKGKKDKKSDDPFDISFEFGSEKDDSVDLQLGSLSASKPVDLLNLILSDGSLDVQKFIK